jgi:hypothetical protein
MCCHFEICFSIQIWRHILQCWLDNHFSTESVVCHFSLMYCISYSIAVLVYLGCKQLYITFLNLQLLCPLRQHLLVWVFFNNLPQIKCMKKRYTILSPFHLNIRRALSVGRPTRAEKIGCCPGRPIAIYRLELAAFRFLHFAPWFLENQPAVLSLSV